MQRNGEMFIIDAINNATVCCLIAPTTHLPASPWAPVYVLDTVRQMLFIRGDLISASAAATESIQSHLLVFRFGEQPLFKTHAAGAPGDAVQPGTIITLEQACDRYLQQRSLLAGQDGKTPVSHVALQLQENAQAVGSNKPLANKSPFFERCGDKHSASVRSDTA
ncbi:unnamed protein product [Merluccius merluccius]